MPDTTVESFEIKNISNREHIEYTRKRELWDFLTASYRGGLGVSNRYSGLENATDVRQAIRSGYYPGLFKFRREEDDDYSLRVQMTPYRPYARRIVKTFAKYVTKDDPEREGVDAYADYIEDIDGKGTPLTLFTRNIISMYLALGSMNVLVDVPQSDVEPVSKLHAKQAGLRPYVVPILPQQVVDYDIDNYGRYKWCIIQTSHIVNDLTKDSAVEVIRRTYWDSNVWVRYEKQGNDKFKKTGEGTHGAKRTPVIRVIEDDIDNDVMTPEAWFFDLADINRAIYNLESLDLANFYYQTLGILVVPGKSMGEEQSAVEVSNHTATFENGQEEKGITRFVSPAGTPYESFSRKIEELKLEMFRVAGLSQRKDTREAESAESKEWDFQDTNQFLASVGHVANFLENQILDICAAYTSQTYSGYVSYPKDYKVDDVAALVASALDLKTIGFTSETGRKEVLKKVYHELLPDMSPDTMKLIDSEIDASTENDPLMDLGMQNLNEGGVTSTDVKRDNLI